MSAYTATRSTLALIGAATVAAGAFLVGSAVAAERRLRATERRHQQMDAAYRRHRASPDSAAGAGDSTDRGSSVTAPAPVADPGGAEL